MAKIKNLKTCTFCSKEVYRIAGHGLCAACYQRERKNGTPDYVKVRKPCAVDGCANLAAAQGYCEMHYKRWRKHGVVEGERFDNWGQGATHPQYQRWSWICRNREPKAEAWNDFWVFVRDVGDPPSPRHKLFRVDRNQPHGPGNFEWRDRSIDISSSAERNAYMRAYRLTRPREAKNDGLKKLYGIGIVEFEAMLADQKSVCAICGQPERAVDKKTKQTRDLAVDHDHVSGAVRGLLCTGCNSGLGHFKDDPTVLRAAADYLERHRVRTQEVPEP